MTFSNLKFIGKKEEGAHGGGIYGGFFSGDVNGVPRQFLAKKEKDPGKTVCEYASSRIANKVHHYTQRKKLDLAIQRLTWTRSKYLQDYQKLLVDRKNLATEQEQLRVDNATFDSEKKSHEERVQQLEQQGVSEGQDSKLSEQLSQQAKALKVKGHTLILAREKLVKEDKRINSESTRLSKEQERLIRAEAKIESLAQKLGISLTPGGEINELKMADGDEETSLGEVKERSSSQKGMPQRNQPPHLSERFAVVHPIKGSQLREALHKQYSNEKAYQDPGSEETKETYVASLFASKKTMPFWKYAYSIYLTQDRFKEIRKRNNHESLTMPTSRPMFAGTGEAGVVIDAVMGVLVEENPELLTEFAEIRSMSFIIRNLDNHTGNWVVSLPDAPEGQPLPLAGIHIHAIDFAGAADPAYKNFDVDPLFLRDGKLKPTNHNDEYSKTWKVTPEMAETSDDHATTLAYRGKSIAKEIADDLLPKIDGVHITTDTTDKPLFPLDEIKAYVETLGDKEFKNYEKLNDSEKAKLLHSKLTGLLVDDLQRREEHLRNEAFRIRMSLCFKPKDKNIDKANIRTELGFELDLKMLTTFYLELFKTNDYLDIKDKIDSMNGFQGIGQEDFNDELRKISLDVLEKVSRLQAKFPNESPNIHLINSPKIDLNIESPIEKEIQPLLDLLQGLDNQSGRYPFIKKIKLSRWKNVWEEQKQAFKQNKLLFAFRDRLNKDYKNVQELIAYHGRQTIPVVPFRARFWNAVIDTYELNRNSSRWMQMRKMFGWYKPIEESRWNILLNPLYFVAVLPRTLLKLALDFLPEVLKQASLWSIEAGKARLNDKKEPFSLTSLSSLIYHGVGVLGIVFGAIGAVTFWVVREAGMRIASPIRSAKEVFHNGKNLLASLGEKYNVPRLGKYSGYFIGVIGALISTAVSMAGLFVVGAILTPVYLAALGGFLGAVHLGGVATFVTTLVVKGAALLAKSIATAVGWATGTGAASGIISGFASLPIVSTVCSYFASTGIASSIASTAVAAVSFVGGAVASVCTFFRSAWSGIKGYRKKNAEVASAESISSKREREEPVSPRKIKGQSRSNLTHVIRRLSETPVGPPQASRTSPVVESGQADASRAANKAPVLAVQYRSPLSQPGVQSTLAVPEDDATSAAGPKINPQPGNVASD